jgi:hypothetical protein
MDEQSLNISIFDVGGENEDHPQTTPQRSLTDVIADFEKLFQQDLFTPASRSNHYLLLDKTAHLPTVEKLLGHPATIIHNNPVIISIPKKPTHPLPNNVTYHNTQQPLQIMPNTALFNQNLEREATIFKTRTPQQWLRHLNEQEVSTTCSEFFQQTKTPPHYLSQWLNAIQ